jgi:hypothetical protein
MKQSPFASSRSGGLIEQGFWFRLLPQNDPFSFGKSPKGKA